MAASHLLYGLRLASSVAIPGLIEADTAAAADVRVYFGQAPSLLPCLRSAWAEWSVSDLCDERGCPALTIAQDVGTRTWFRLSYCDGTEFFVDRAGQQIWATWADTSTLEDTASYLVGPVFGFLLRLRNVVCLHGSAILISDQVIALVGPSGTGKSTLAAALARRGYPILSDDIVPVTTVKGTCWAQPGYPRLKLWPSSVQLLQEAQQSGYPLPRPQGESRCRLDLTRNRYQFCADPQVLSVVYVLHRMAADTVGPAVESLTGVDAFLSVVGNTYATDLLDAAQRAREFEQLGDIVSQISVRTVRYGSEPSQLMRVCDAIVTDAQSAPDQMADVMAPRRGPQSLLVR